MGTRIVSDIIAQASEIVQDESNVVWTAAQGLRWLNDAVLSIVSVRPDAYALLRIQVLSPGTRQTITGLRLMSVIRNMGTDGSTPGRAIRLVERGVKDDYSLDWHSDTATTAVKEYMYDARTPKTFYVWPPVHATTNVTVELNESFAPSAITNTAQAVPLEDIYVPAIIEWIVYRFLIRDAEENPNIQRSVMHFQNFFAMLGVQVKADMAINPKVREQLE